MAHLHPDYQLDATSRRVIRRDAAAEMPTADLVFEPGELADIADGGRLQDVLSAARRTAAENLGPDGERNLLGALWSLHEEDGVLLIRWVTPAGFRAFGRIVEDAWRSCGEWAFVHFVSTDTRPICWCEGLDPLDEAVQREDTAPH
jgi:hypothetical protein